jgi:hypothetical protein
MDQHPDRGLQLATLPPEGLQSLPAPPDGGQISPLSKTPPKSPIPLKKKKSKEGLTINIMSLPNLAELSLNASLRDEEIGGMSKDDSLNQKKILFDSISFSEYEIEYKGKKNEVFVSGINALSNSFLEEREITHIFRFGRESHPFYDTQKVLIPITLIELADFPTSPTSVREFVSKPLEEFERLMERGDSKVIVHCHMGHSRSPGFLAAFLIRYLNLTKDDAISLVKEKRSSCCPSMSIIETYM